MADAFESECHNLPILAPHGLSHIIDLAFKEQRHGFRQIEVRSQSAARGITMVLACGRGCEAQTGAGTPEPVRLGPPRTCASFFTDYGDLLIRTSAKTLAKHLGNR
jgi:hypothetical protein